MAKWIGSECPRLNFSPVDNVDAKSSTLLHHVSEMLVELRGSSGDVQGLDGWAIFDYLDLRDRNVAEVGALLSDDQYTPAWGASQHAGMPSARKSTAKVLSVAAATYSVAAMFPRCIMMGENLSPA